MFDALKTLLANLAPVDPAAQAEADDHALQLATAVMLVEVMRADTRFEAAERRAVVEALQQHFVLGDEETQDLVALAEQAAQQSTDWFGFTSQLNARLDMPAKLRMIEHMWAVAYADGQLSAHEQHVLWRVADLLHVPHGAYIRAKMRAKAAAGGSGEDPAT